MENERSSCRQPTGGGINITDSTPHARGNAANQAGSFLSLPRATRFGQQVDKLRERKLVIEDDAEPFVLGCLKDLNYYRLRGYWLTLENEGAFIEGTSFDDIWNIYQLDRELRIWIWRAVAPIEIKFRTQFAYHMANLCEPDAYLDVRYFRCGDKHRQSIRIYEQELRRARGRGTPFVVHNLDKYGKLPVWAAVEIMSFGMLSKLYGNLRRDAGRIGQEPGVADAVAKAFHTRPYYLKSWIHHLVNVRNIVAHHNRFYNRAMSTRPHLLRRDVDCVSDGNKQFLTFLTIKRLYETSWPDDWDSLAGDLGKHFDAHPDVNLAPMGFPEDWRSMLGM